MKTVFVQNFGCRASQADGSAIEAVLEDNGFVRAGDASTANLLVVNTCTVTHSADTDARRTIRDLHRDHPSADILVTGCYAQRAPDEVAEIEGVRWVVGNSHKDQIAEIVSATTEDYHGQIKVADIGQQRVFRAAPVRGTRDDRTRPNLKVQDGCSNRCSFCIIPSVRGPSRSATLESVVEQVAQLANKYREIVLTGINLGRWGRDLPGNSRFVDLVREILSRTVTERLRISSVEPMDWSEPLLQLMADEKRIAKHVHIPLQSGSDAVLKRMHRKYRLRHYSTRVELARKLMPEAAIGADVMTGFPGESDADFEQSLRFIESNPFTYLHVFTYSERPGTRSATYQDSVPMEVRRERTRVLRQLAESKNRRFRLSMIGKTLSAVTLEQRGVALTSNFLRVELASIRKPNTLIDVEISSLSDSGLKERSVLHIL